MMNQLMGSLLRSLVSQNTRNWETVFGLDDRVQSEFTFNASVNRTTGETPFEIIYGLIPNQVVDLVEMEQPSHGVEELLEKI